MMQPYLVASIMSWCHHTNCVISNQEGSPVWLIQERKKNWQPRGATGKAHKTTEQCENADHCSPFITVPCVAASKWIAEMVEKEREHIAVFGLRNDMHALHSTSWLLLSSFPGHTRASCHTFGFQSDWIDSWLVLAGLSSFWKPQTYYLLLKALKVITLTFWHQVTNSVSQ